MNNSNLSILVYLNNKEEFLINFLKNKNFYISITNNSNELIAYLKNKSPQVLIITHELTKKIYDILIDVRAFSKTIFIIVFNESTINNAQERYNFFQLDVNMVSYCYDSICKILSEIENIKSNKGNFICPQCEEKNLTEDGLWMHLPLYHINKSLNNLKCPKCKILAYPNLQVHYRNKHGLCSKGIISPEENSSVELYSFALVVVHRKIDNSYLLVQEFSNSGYWLPGGRVDSGEELKKAAIRETKEEAGIDIKLTGVLTFQIKNKKDYARLRVIFYAEPIDEKQLAKSIPDYESVGAIWVKYEEIIDLPLRGNEPLKWIGYVKNGNIIHPLSILSDE